MVEIGSIIPKKNNLAMQYLVVSGHLQDILIKNYKTETFLLRNQSFF